MVDEALKKFANELKSIREKKAISLNEIHDKTRIDLKYLNEIEEGNFDALPEVYMRGFLRKYVEMIGLDQDEILSNFELAKGENLEETEPAKSKKIELDKNEFNKKSDTFDDFEDEKPIKEEKNDNGKKKNYFVITMVLFVSAVIVILYFSFKQKSPEEIVIEKPIEEIINEQNNQPIEKTIKISNKKEESKSSAVVEDSLSLRIHAVDTSWMRLMVDNKFRDEFILNPNFSKSVKAKSNFSLLVGNAGGIELILNGKRLPQIGKKGEIKNISVDSSGIHYMRIKKN